MQRLIQRPCRANPIANMKEILLMQDDNERPTIPGDLPPFVILDGNTASDLADTIRGLMFHWHRNDFGSDIRCEFCHVEAITNLASTITHRNGCQGEQFLAALEPKDS